MKNKRESTHLEELRHKHWYDIADDEPDIIHWNIVDDSAKKIGVVKDILFDKEAKKARYLITNLKDGMLEKDARVLVPVGKARLKKEDKRIVLPAVSLQQLSRLPEYNGPEDLTAEDEHKIREVFSGTGATSENTGTYDRERFYEHEDFREDRYFGKS